MYDLVSVRKRNESSLASVFNGLFFDFQSGISSSSALVSITAPETICAPTSDPFSITQTEISLLFFLLSCFSLIAALSPEGPAPTTTTSYSITSLVLI